MSDEDTMTAVVGDVDGLDFRRARYTQNLKVSGAGKRALKLAWTSWYVVNGAKSKAIV